MQKGLKNMKKLEEIIECHENRIIKLEKADIKLFERMDNLIQKICSLTEWMKWFTIAILSGSIGFIIWYIQQL
jgi:hypothetical protein